MGGDELCLPPLTGGEVALADREGDTLTLVRPPLPGWRSTGAEECWCSCGTVLKEVVAGGGRLICFCCLGCLLRAAPTVLTGRRWCCCLCWLCFVAPEEELEVAGLLVAAPLVLAELAVREVREAVLAGGDGCCKPAAVLRVDRIFLNTAPIPPEDSDESLCF